MKLNIKFKNLLIIFLIFIIIIFSYINSKKNITYQPFGNKKINSKKDNNENKTKDTAAFLYSQDANI
tara:strand:+ start:2478 stop:2678 length:201 start_codon:yes stop_codon:yes gene_type:complete